jgi:hypothetical protein
VIFHRRAAWFAVASCLSAVAGSAVAASSILGPVETSGNLSYNYRASTEDGSHENTSHQIMGNVNASTYYMEPWLATGNLSLTLTQDSSETSDTAAGSTSTADSQIMTGDLSVNVLPQSKTPFNLNLQVSDSRVDTAGTGQIPITFAAVDYSSMFLGLRQTVLARNGDRYQASLDLRNWEATGSGEYDDQVIRGEADMRWPKQRFFARGSMETNEHSLSTNENEILTIDLNHYYYPWRNFRVDSKASIYEYDRSFMDPSASDTRLSSTDITQASSYVFWRPEKEPFSFSGGVRVFTMDGVQSGVAANDQTQVAFNGGVFYQLNTHVRLDASLTSTFKDEADVSKEYHRQHGGVDYHTDYRQIYGFSHQAYVSGDIDNRAEPDYESLDMGATAGHGGGRTWWLGERTSATSLRLNLSQSLDYSTASGLSNDLDSSSSLIRFNHAGTLSFNQRVWQGNTLARLTISDSRDSSDSQLAGVTTDSDSERQLMNFQLSRSQDVGRRTSVDGSITVQFVRNEVTAASVTTKTSTRTATARIKFQHNHMFGVPRLLFVSDYVVMDISASGAVDREDWSNRLAYNIGKLETSFSYRLTETDSRNYDLLYFRAVRRF